MEPTILALVLVAPFITAAQPFTNPWPSPDRVVAYTGTLPGKARTVEEASNAIKNMFAVLMEATKYCSLGQLTAAMFEVGGQYRRNM